MRTGIAILLVVLAGACREQSPSATATEAPPAPPSSEREEPDNLLNAGLGAAVVSRTGELTLENSAIRAIDGDPGSVWASPPLDFDQTLTFSFPAPVRIDKVGVRTPRSQGSRTKTLVFEASLDGRSFTSVGSPQLDTSAETQLFDAAVPEARYLRVTTKEGGERVAALQSIEVHGQWLGPRSAPPIAGCWTINGWTASFAESNGRISGFIDADGPTMLDGGLDGAVYRFAWARGPEWGYALVTLTPDGSRLSGMTWHEEPAEHSFGTSWFGERSSCTSQKTDPDRVVAGFLSRAGWYPLFSIRFDESGNLVELPSRSGLDIIAGVLRRPPSEKIRLVARDYGDATPEGNLRLSETKLRSLREVLAGRGLDVGRIEFSARGNESPRRCPTCFARPTATETMRAFYGVVEIELPAIERSPF